MAKIRILGQFDCVTSDKILAVAEQISYEETTVAAALDSKQDALTFDSAPVQNSTNPVTSGGLYTKFTQVEESVSSLSNNLSTNYYTSAATDSAISAAFVSKIATDSEFNEMLSEIFAA